MKEPVSMIPGGVITKLIENRTAYSFEHSELCLYETFERCESQPLVFRNPVIVSMLSGKKVMHVDGRPPFEFHPGETLVFAPNRPMVIDFPEASPDHPTRCLTLELESKNVEEMMDMLNDLNPKADGTWQLTPENVFYSNNREVEQSLQRLVLLTLENNPAKKILFGLGLKELIIRLLQTHARHILLQPEIADSENRLARAIEYIRQNLHDHISIDEVCDQACMSKPSLFRHFRNELGFSPNDFISRERIRLAKQRLREKSKSVTDICYELGYNHVSYFVRQFKKYEGITPKQYQVQIEQTNATPRMIG
jgi:AraC-like DNA-binding protein